MRFVVAEQNREVVEQLRHDGVHAVAGEGSDPAVLIQAHVARASVLVIATPNAFKARQMMEVARMLNPTVRILVRTHGETEAALLEKEGADGVFIGEYELAATLGREALQRLREREDEASSTH